MVAQLDGTVSINEIAKLEMENMKLYQLALNTSNYTKQLLSRESQGVWLALMQLHNRVEHSLKEKIEIANYGDVCSKWKRSVETRFEKLYPAVNLSKVGSITKAGKTTTDAQGVEHEYDYLRLWVPADKDDIKEAFGDVVSCAMPITESQLIEP